MPKKTYSYSDEKLAPAIEAVNNGTSKKGAASIFNIPKSTIQIRLKNSEIVHFQCDPAPILTKKEEHLLVQWIFECTKKGFPRRKVDLLFSVKNFLEANQRSNRFKDNLPGVGWYKSFLKRNPVLSERTSEHVTTSSADVSEKDIRKWFTDIGKYLNDEGLAEILEDPRRVFNGDETGFSLCPKMKTVLGPKEAKDVYGIAKSNSKENLTVMFTFNANGEMCCPMVIFNYQRIPQDIIESVPANWGIGRSASGLMVSDGFYEFIANVFHPFVVQSGISFPVILFVDGHKSHLTYHLSNLCTNLKIILIALYPNATRILQPADVAAFRPLKAGWKSEVMDWRNKNVDSAITKKDFAPILEKVINNTITPYILKNGFKACGLFPWNADQIDYRKCLGRNESIENVISNDLHSNQSITLKEFSDIIGPDIVKKFNNIRDVVTTESHTVEFYMLYRLYEKFNKPTKNNIGIVEDGQNKNYLTQSSNIIFNENNYIPNVHQNIQPLSNNTSQVSENNQIDSTSNYNLQSPKLHNIIDNNNYNQLATLQNLEKNNFQEHSFKKNTGINTRKKRKNSN